MPAFKQDHKTWIDSQTWGTKTGSQYAHELAQEQCQSDEATQACVHNIDAPDILPTVTFVSKAGVLFQSVRIRGVSWRL